MTITPTWADVYAEQYRHADLQRQAKKDQLAASVAKQGPKSVPSSRVYLAISSFAIALLAHVLPHAIRS